MKKKVYAMMAIVGVIILILAGIGISIYSYEPGEDKAIEPKEKLYYPVFTEEYKEMTINGLAEKTYSDKVTINGVPSNAILTSVDFQISWDDDKTIGLIIKRGEDTLKIDITYMGETKTKSSIGSGSDTITFDINNVPSVDSIEANNETGAKDLLYEMLSGKNEACFDISVTVETGEPIYRPIKRFLDKGDDFEIKVKYWYYSVELELGSEEDDGEIDIPFETWLFLILPLVCVILATVIYLLWERRRFK